MFSRNTGGDQHTLERIATEEDDVCNPYSILNGHASSYGCSAAVLYAIGANTENAWMYGVPANLLLFVVPLFFFRRVSLSLFSAMVLWAIVRGLFLQVLTKELIVGIVVALSIIIVLRRKSSSGWVMFASLYGAIFRIYWLLVLAIWIVLSRLRRALRPLNLLAAIFLGYMLIATIFAFVLDMPISSIRGHSNESRVLGEEGARTLILPWLDSDNFLLQGLDAFLVFLRLAVPVEALYLSPGVSQLIVAFLVPVTLYYIFSIISKRRSNDSDLQLAQKIALIPIVFLMVQGLFEPDYGSFIRHFSMLTPYVFCAIGLARRETAQ